MTIPSSQLRQGTSHADPLILANDDKQVLAVGASITLEQSVDAGLGQHADTLSNGQLNTYVKLTYTTLLLGIIAQACSKFSVMFLYERLAPRQNKTGIRILLGAISAWTIFAVFATALACGGDISWGSECPAQSYIAFPVLATDLIR